MPTADFTNLLSLLGDFYRRHADLPQFKQFWKGLVRIQDNEWLQLEQTRDSLTMPFLPTYIRHTHLYRQVKTWSDTGVFHRHFKKAMRAGTSQSIFYLGAFVNPQETRVYLEGKELDLETGKYVITYEQDTTQPSVNPRGSRLIFPHTLQDGVSVQVISDRETFWLDETVTSPTSVLSYGGVANELSVQLKIDSQDITTSTQINGAGTELTYVASGATNPNTTDTRQFLAGEVLRFVDPSGSYQDVTVQQTAQSVTISPAVSPSCSVFRMINLDITPGKVVLEADRVSVPGQTFSPNVMVRVRDAGGLQTVHVTAPTSVVTFDRAVNVDEAEVTMFSGSIYRGITIGDETVTFDRAFQVGTRFHVLGDYYMLHDHASQHQVMDGTDDIVWVPSTRPMAVLNTPSGIVEDPELPVEVYVDGALIPADDWTFLSGHETTAVRLIATGQPTPVPAGTNLNLYYTDLEDVRLHKHVRDRFVAADGQIAYQLSEPHDLRYPYYAVFDGFLQGNPENSAYADNQNFLQVLPPTSDSVIVEVRGARMEYPYTAEIDTDVEEYMFVEEDVSPARVIWAQTLQNGLDPSDTILSIPVQDGEEVLEDGFLISPIPSTVSGFTLKSSEKWEDLWFLQADVDEKTAWRNFGWVIDFKRETSFDYVRTIQALYAAYFRGSQRYTLENFTNLVMGSSFLDAPATLSRVQEGRLQRDAIVESVDGQTLSYELSNDVPDSLWRGEQMPKFHALTQYCQVLDLTAENFPWLPVAASDFSVDYAFAKSFDFQNPSIITGENPAYDPVVYEFVDETKDFVEGPEGTVWVGDLIEVTWSGGSKGYGRITEVIDKTKLKVKLNVPEVLLPYGQGAYGGGPPGLVHAYGGSRAFEQLVSYSIWVRRIRRLDSHHFLDSLSPSEFSYVTSVLVPLLDKFVFLVKFNWAGLSEGLLGDVKHFLDTAKPAASRYIAFSNVNEDDGIVDSAGLEFADEVTEVEIIPNLFAVGLGAIDGGDPIGASIEVA